jgi:hypothetical protein
VRPGRVQGLDLYEQLFDTGRPMSSSVVRLHQRTPASLEDLQARLTPLTRADEQLHPVDERFHAVLPWPGLRRGSVIESESQSVAWALVAQAMQAGAWAAVVGSDSCGWAAAAELGVPLERVAVIAAPPPEVAVTVLAALVDAIEIVLVDPSVHLRPAELRRLLARVRERRGLLISFGPVGQAWEGVEVRLRVTESRWHGLGEGGDAQGSGALCGREVTLESTGRGAAFRPRTTSLWLQGSAARWPDASAEEVSADDTAAQQGTDTPEVQGPEEVELRRFAG